MYVRIEKNLDGSHAFQSGGILDSGWAVVPEGIEIPSTFPFVNIEVAEVTHPAVTTTKRVLVNDEYIDNIIVLIPEYTQLEVVSMTEGEEIYVEQPDMGLTTEKRITALEEENIMLMECLLEMSEIVYA